MGFIKDMMSFIKMDDDSLDDEYDNYVQREEDEEDYPEDEPKKRSFFKSSKKNDDYEEEEAAAAAPVRTSQAKQNTQAKVSYDDYQAQASVSELKKDRTSKGSQSPSKVVPIRNSARGFEVKVRKPTCFEDSQDICDVILSGCAAIINLEGFDVELAQRVMDFVSGSIYAVNGKLHQISNYIFIVSPDNVDISGDYFDILRDSGFGVPTLTKGF